MRSCAVQLPKPSHLVPEMTGPEQFLSEEDLDLRNLSWDELLAQWNAWLQVASATDEEDANEYSHGVFVRIQEPLRNSE